MGKEERVGRPRGRVLRNILRQMPTVEEEGMTEDGKLNTKHIEELSIALKHMHLYGEHQQKLSVSSTVMLFMI